MGFWSTPSPWPRGRGHMCFQWKKWFYGICYIQQSMWHCYYQYFNIINLNIKMFRVPNNVYVTLLSLNVTFNLLKISLPTKKKKKLWVLLKFPSFCINMNVFFFFLITKQREKKCHIGINTPKIKLVENTLNLI